MAGATEWAVAVAQHSGSWGDAGEAVAAGDGVKIMSESLGSGIPEPIVDENVGDSLAGGTYQGNVAIEGNLVVPFRFEGLERLTALLMGQSGTPTTVEAGIAFEHAQVFQDSNTGKFATVAIDKSVGIHEYPAVKFSSLELGFNNGKLVGTFGCIANRCDRDAAATNDAAAILAATPPSSSLLVLWTQLQVLLTEVTGSEGNLDSADELLVSDLTFSVDRNLSGDQVTGTLAGQVDEPETDGLPEASLSLTFPNYVAGIDQLIEDAATIQAGREPKVYKAQLIFTGKEIPTTASANTYHYIIELPAITIRDAPTNAGGPGAKIPVQFDFDVVTPQTVPDGTDWSWVTANSTPFRFRIQNGNSAAALA